MTMAEAVAKAKARARKAEEVRYVVWDCTDEGPDSNKYHVATDEDLDTYYCGLPDSHIVFCTAE